MQHLFDLIASVDRDQPHYPPSLIYNEGWLLKLALNWFATSKTEGFSLAFFESASWFSDGSMPTAFRARYRGDPYAELRTHFDGVIGHIVIGRGGKSDLALAPDPAQLVIIEGKIFSGLSAGTRNIKYFDQAARNVAAIAEVLKRADCQPASLAQLAFYVLAPQSRIEQKIFEALIDKSSITSKVRMRIREYEGGLNEWYHQWFTATLNAMDIRTISWEQVISFIQSSDQAYGEKLSDFYKLCLKYNL